MHVLVFLLVLIGLIVVIGLLVLGIKEAWKFYLKVDKYNRDNKEPEQVETKQDD